MAILWLTPDEVVGLHRQAMLLEKYIVPSTQITPQDKNILTLTATAGKEAK